MIDIKFYGARWSASSFNVATVYAQRAVDCYRRNSGITPLRIGDKNPLVPTSDFMFARSFYLHDDKLVATVEATDFASSATDDDANRRLFFVHNSLLQFMTYDEVPANYPTPLTAQGHRAGVTAPNNAPLYGGAQTTGAEVREKLYTYTYVTRFGEESSPSFTSNRILYDDTTGSIQLQGLIDSADPDVVGKRVYELSSGIWRQVQGGTTIGGQPFINVASGVTQITVSPNLTGRALRVSDNYDQAPANILYMAELDNEVLAIASKHQVLISVRGQWGAFPLEQRFGVAHPITAIDKIPGGLAVFTTHGVRMYDVGLPSQVRERRTRFPYPATDPRSMAHLDDGSLVYCTSEGIGLIDTGAPRIITDGWIDREAWQKNIGLDNVRLSTYEGMVMIMTKKVVRVDGYIFNLSTQEIFEWSVPGTAAIDKMTDFFRDPRNGQLCYVGDSVGLTVFNEGELSLGLYETEKIKLQGQVEIGAVGVVADEYPVAFEVLLEGETAQGIVIESGAPRWIPGTRRREDVQYRFRFSAEIARCTLGEVIEQCG